MYQGEGLVSERVWSRGAPGNCCGKDGDGGWEGERQGDKAGREVRNKRQAGSEEGAREKGKEKKERARNDQNIKSKLNQKTKVRQMVTYVIWFRQHTYEEWRGW